MRKIILAIPITGNYWAERPTTMKIKGEWMVYFDKYRIISMALSDRPIL
ncbi:MAG TPA: hypothetical protein VFP97_14760 [Chitinophagaceae bacterium]|nr:hypothetical protein [Chitinophagaceae bacterium]